MQRPEEHTAPGADPQGEFIGWRTHEDEAPAKRAEGVPSGEGEASAAGALSVTRPPQNAGEETAQPLSHAANPQVLLTGTDTLDLGLYVDFPESYQRLLGKLKA